MNKRYIIVLLVFCYTAHSCTDDTGSEFDQFHGAWQVSSAQLSSEAIDSWGDGVLMLSKGTGSSTIDYQFEGQPDLGHGVWPNEGTLVLVKSSKDQYWQFVRDEQVDVRVVINQKKMIMIFHEAEPTKWPYEECDDSSNPCIQIDRTQWLFEFE